MANILAVAGPGSKYSLPGANLAGFWAGLWHGLICQITFIVSLFSPDGRIYEAKNSASVRSGRDVRKGCRRQPLREYLSVWGISDPSSASPLQHRHLHDAQIIVHPTLQFVRITDAILTLIKDVCTAYVNNTYNTTRSCRSTAPAYAGRGVLHLRLDVPGRALRQGTF
jgi:hypothetical protein